MKAADLSGDCGRNMNRLKSETLRAKLLAANRRKALSTSGEGLVELSRLDAADALPLVIQPIVNGVGLRAWAEGNRDLIEDWLLKHGALLFRHFDVGGVEEFEALITTLYGRALAYLERSSPRSQVSGNIYTSTDYPAEQSIFLHNENSYQQSWPMRIAFFCRKPPGAGGETPIADCRRVFARIDPAIRESFAQRKWMYVRNLGGGAGLSWQTVFQ